ncbi:hypothetical protein B0H16DRAFT_1332570 [Mycena metata]|uniref:Integrase core domain-containing protein n=1 Tax=Mycena metata TaxID=1033252 RepID=A0AAD7HRN1_9AGAR|nr:hypothetical protein B0H16DRAFT_1332570 [Mycena metata]
MANANNDPVHTFLMEAHNICVQAQFIVDSFPNADLPAVERSTHQLSAVRQIVVAIVGPEFTERIREELLATVDRLWRDVRKDALEAFRQIFDYLEKNELLDMENPIHSVCLFLVFHRRIQAALDRAREAWNHHRMRTQHDKTPVAMYELSRAAAITRGYWTGDPGDDNDVASDPLYGYDGEAPLPPAAAIVNEPLERTEQPVGTGPEREGGILVNDDEELGRAKELLGEFDCDRDDGNWGIEVYVEAVILMMSRLGLEE